MKLYLREHGSDELSRQLTGRVDLLVSDLAVTEAMSALSRVLRQGAIPPVIARRVQQTIVAHLDEGTFRRLELTRDVHRRAEQLLMTLVETPLRAADALHLALAITARAGSMASFDARLAVAARAVGLVVYPG